jgi:DNA-binding NtrC family response regulator
VKRGGDETAEALRGLSVLVVEDEFLLLTELETMLHEAGVECVHLCRTLGEATSMLDCCEVSAAILDVRIGRESVAPVAHQLAERKTPFVFYTGQTARDPVIQEWSDHPVLSKPTPPQRVISTLATLVNVELPDGMRAAT